MPLRARESPIYILMQDCRKTSVLGEVTHEPRTATFESKRERVQIGYIWGFPLPGGAYLLLHFAHLVQKLNLGIVQLLGKIDINLMRIYETLGFFPESILLF